MTVTATICRGKSFYHTIMTMTASIGKSESYHMTVNSIGGAMVSMLACNNSPWIEMSPNSDTLLWFQANQSLFLLHNAACLAEMQWLSLKKLHLGQMYYYKCYKLWMDSLHIMINSPTITNITMLALSWSILRSSNNIFEIVKRFIVGKVI
jgi:hypothetical protein